MYDEGYQLVGLLDGRNVLVFQGWIERLIVRISL